MGKKDVAAEKKGQSMTWEEAIRKATEELHESIKSTVVAAVKVWVKESPDAESFELDVEFPNTNIDHIATVITCNLFEATPPMSKDEIMNRARNGVDLIISPLLDGIIASMRKVGFEHSDESAFRKMMWDSREVFANIIRIAMTQKEIERVEDAPLASMTSVIEWTRYGGNPETVPLNKSLLVVMRAGGESLGEYIKFYTSLVQVQADMIPDSLFAEYPVPDAYGREAMYEVEGGWIPMPIMFFMAPNRMW